MEQPMAAPRSRFTHQGYSDAAEAEKFVERPGGEKFDSKQRGKGRNWVRWRK
jgi:hypothetical protein